MTGTTCAECGSRPAAKSTPTGRGLCDECFKRYVGLAAAGTSIATTEGFFKRLWIRVVG